MSKDSQVRSKRRSSTIPLNNDKAVSNRIIKASHKNEGQAEALLNIDQNKITFLTGVPGTGKTFLAASYGLQMLLRDKYKRIVLTRPVVEAGEKLGFLPGNFDEKIAPYMIPLFDVMGEHLSMDDIESMISERKIVILPLAFMRGVTFRDSYVVLDEAQNATSKQLHMMLTRLGENSKIVVAGDINQSDVGYKSGLQDAVERLRDLEGVGHVHLGDNCVVRDPLVAEIDRRYREKD